MKTIENLYKEIAGSPELQAELKSASGEMLGSFLKSTAALRTFRNSERS